MDFRTRLHLSSRRRIVIVSATAALAVAALIATIAISAAAPAGTPTPGAGAKPPATVYVPATFAGWKLEGDGTTSFSAEYGLAGKKGTSLRIDASGSAPRALQQLVPVKPDTKYQFRALVAGSGTSASASGVALRMGSTDATLHKFSPASTSWTEATWSHTTGKNETELALSLVATGKSAGVRIDKLTMTSDAQPKNLIANGSFEDFAAPTQITNTSLIMKTGDARLGLAWRAPSVTWSVANEAGTAVAGGKLTIPNGLGLLALDKLRQGYYNASLTSSDGSIAAQQVSFMVLDNPDAPSKTDDRFGIGLHIGAPSYVGSADAAAQLGFRHARNDAYWKNIEKTPGKYDFPASVDQETDAFQAAGLKTLPISVYTNKLYDNGNTPSSPTGIAAYAAYTSAVVGHFSPDAVEVYNEFNWTLNNSACGKTADCYLQLLRPTADKVRAEHPGTLIVGPSTALLDDTFMTQLYQGGGLKYLDAISIHPYDELNAGSEILLPLLTKLNDRIKEYNNGKSKPIWLTEMGWTSGKVGETRQANYLVRGQTIAFAHGVERFYWYDLVNDNLVIADGEGNFGLLRQTNKSVPAFAPKPAAMAQAILARKIADKNYATQDGLNDSTFSYAFGAGASTTRVAWATTPTTVTYASKEPVTVTTQYGATSVVKPVSGRISIPLTDQAVYLDGALSDAAIG